MQRSLFVLGFIGLLLFTSSCNFGNGSNKEKEIPEAERIKIYQDYFSNNPVYSFQLKGNLYYVDVLEEAGKKRNVLIIMNKVGNYWNDSLKITLSDTSYLVYAEIDSIKKVEIDGNPYLYYEEAIPGGSSGNYGVQFTLLDLNSYNAYSKSFNEYYITYDYWPTPGTGTNKFEKSESLAGHEMLSEFLQKRVDSSLKIHKPSAMEKLEQDFLISNEEQIKKLQNPFYSDSVFQLTKKEITENIFSTDYSKLLKDNSLVATAKSGNYIVVSFFKGPVMGYNKLTKEYFCIWVPKDQYEWIKNVSFRTDGNLFLSGTDIFTKEGTKTVMKEGPNLLINLDNFTYSYLPKSEDAGDESSYSDIPTNDGNSNVSNSTLDDVVDAFDINIGPRYLLGVLYYTITTEKYVPEKTIVEESYDLAGHNKGYKIPAHTKKDKTYYISVSAVEKVENLTNDKKYQFLDAIEHDFRTWKMSSFGDYNIYNREVKVYDSYSAASIARQRLLNNTESE